VIDKGKAFYSIAESARLLGMKKDALYLRIKTGDVPRNAIVSIGGKLFIKAFYFFKGADDKPEPESGETASAAETEAGQYLAEIREDLLRLLENAPKFGKCGIDVTFHDGKIYKLDIHQAISRIHEEDEE
jgi:hypothetical protein